MMLVVLGAAAMLMQDPDQARARVDAVVQCLDIADNARRLACFDENARSLRTGVASGEVLVGEPSRQRMRLPMDAHVAAATVTGGGQWRIELDNGLIWVTQERQSARRLPPVGSSVRIEKGALGNGFWLRIPSGGSYRIDRG